MFAKPSTREMYVVGSRWARSMGLDPYISLLAQHDWVHATFKLSPTQEGIVFAIEACLDADLLVDFWFFADLCLDNTPAGDSYVFADIERAHAQLSTIWMEDA